MRGYGLYYFSMHVGMLLGPCICSSMIFSTSQPLTPSPWTSKLAIAKHCLLSISVSSLLSTLSCFCLIYHISSSSTTLNCLFAHTLTPTHWSEKSYPLLPVGPLFLSTQS